MRLASKRGLNTFTPAPNPNSSRSNSKLSTTNDVVAFRAIAVQVVFEFGDHFAHFAKMVEAVQVPQDTHNFVHFLNIRSRQFGLSNAKFRIFISIVYFVQNQKP